MASHRSLVCARLSILALLALSGPASFAQSPWFRGGGGGRGGVGGYHPGGWSHGYYPSGGVHYSPGGSRFYVGATVNVLPRGYVTYRHGGDPWFFGGGHWYRPWHGGYAVFYPPVGLWLSTLPLGYTSCVFGGMPYFYYEDVYYTSVTTGGYQVVQPPEGAMPNLKPAPAATDPAADALLVVPKQGQTEAKMVEDRRQAQLHAIRVSGYDPAYADPGDPGTPRARRAYLNALKGYLEDRGYSVK